MGRGFKGAFRGRNIHPGKYVHKDVLTDQFSIRVVRDGVIHTQVRERACVCGCVYVLMYVCVFQIFQ